MVLLLPALLIVPPAVVAAERGLPAEKVKAIEKLLTAQMSEQRIPGLSIAIGIDGALAWSNGYGFADLENFVPATADTVYRSGSIGKTITATGVMQLAERGVLDLDAPIQRYCPAFPKKRWPVTARLLLGHLGGIRAYPDGDDFAAEFYSTVHYDGVTDALKIFKDDPLLHEPGTRYSYTSYGYNVLGCALEGAAETAFLDYLREHIFGPAGMAHTRADDPSAIIPGRARGYVRTDDGELRNSRFVDMSNKMPAGGFLTTAGDLIRFASALMAGTLVRPKTLEAMLTSGSTSGGEVVGYGLGWGLIPDEDWYGETEAFHGGGTPQVSGMLYLLPGRKFAVAVLMNREEVAERLRLTAEIAKVVLDLK